MYHGLLWQSNGTNANSIAYKLRRRRMQIVESFFYDCFHNELKNNYKVKILDIGGTYDFWNSVDFKFLDQSEITLINLEEINVPSEIKNVISIIGDATNLQNISDKSYDFVFSNSCIEHVGKEKEWYKMAHEVKRTGRFFYLQTPNKFFPIEPHFLFPFFQFMPLCVKAYILCHFNIGNFKKTSTYEEAIAVANSVELLSYKDLRRLFPCDVIRREWYFGFVKSFMVMGKCVDVLTDSFE